MSVTQLPIEHPGGPVSRPHLLRGADMPSPMDSISAVIETATVRWRHSRHAPSTTTVSAFSTAGSLRRCSIAIRPPSSCGRPTSAVGRLQEGGTRSVHHGQSRGEVLETHSIAQVRSCPCVPEPENISESEIVVNAEIVYDGKQRATVRPARWFRFRPR